MNRITQLLRCTYPILEGGLAYVGNGLLAGAISTAGGFGQVGCGGRSPEHFAREIEIALKCTDAPFGVNVPISEHSDVEPYFAVIEQYAKRLQAVSLSAGNPRTYIDRLHDWGLVVLTLASTPQQAQKAEQAGADIVVCEGTEAGGHNGPAELTTFSLVPAAVDVVRIPVIAAGGIADGRTMAAALCLGAEGVQLGTRFVATQECEAHEDYKRAIVSSAAEDTVVLERSLGRITRVLKSDYTQAVIRQEQLTPGGINNIMPLVAGRKNKVAAIDGRLQEGWLNCGQSVGLVKDIPSAREVVDRMIAEARVCLGKSYFI